MRVTVIATGFDAVKEKEVKKAKAVRDIKPVVEVPVEVEEEEAAEEPAEESDSYGDELDDILRMLGKRK